MSSSEEYVVKVETAESLRFSDHTGQGWYLKETWTLGAVVHRDFGPAITIRHPVTLVPIQEEFYREGKLHRYSGPAVIVRDPTTGNVVMARFFEKGKERAPRDPFILGGP